MLVGDSRDGNLAPTAASMRLRWGVMMLGATLCVAVLLHELQVHSIARALLVVPLFFAANGFFQGLYKTCPPTAMRGLRELDDGRTERIADPEALKKAKHTARIVMFRSVLGAIVATALYVWASA